MSEILLEVKDLKTHFFTFKGVVKAIDGVSFSLERGESLGIVGESGSGKTVTGLSLLKLIQPPGQIVSGEIIFKNRSLLRLSENQLRQIRGSEMSMIFQNPRTALNPVMPIGSQIDRIYRWHKAGSKKEATKRRLEMLERVSISDPEEFSKRYPHQISGGMCQRAMIVMALMCTPELIIADEPTTGLDVTIQRQIMILLSEIRNQINAAQILITHDLGLVAENSDRLVVMYASKVMEYGSTLLLFSEPAHPYTLSLLRSTPRLDIDIKPEILPGYVPSGTDRPQGCPFHPRCPMVEDICRNEEPKLRGLGSHHFSACHFS